MNSQLYTKKKSHQNEDIWDDTELIKMYEESINPSLKVKSAQGSSNSAPWKVGDKCTAQFAEDGLWYPATIVSIAGPNAEVEYEGYETREHVKLADLSDYATAEEEEEYSESSDAASKSTPAVVPVSYGYSQDSSSPSTALPPSMDALPQFAPPPPPIFDGLAMPDQMEALSSMLMSWYMSGYHTGCYVTMQKMNKNGN